MKFLWDMQNAIKHYNFNNFSNTWDSRNGNVNFAKVESDPRTASIGGQPLMNLTLSLELQAKQKGEALRRLPATYNSAAGVQRSRRRFSLPQGSSRVCFVAH